MMARASYISTGESRGTRHFSKRTPRASVPTGRDSVCNGLSVLQFKRGELIFYYHIGCQFSFPVLQAQVGKVKPEQVLGDPAAQFKVLRAVAHMNSAIMPLGMPI